MTRSLHARQSRDYARPCTRERKREGEREREREIHLHPLAPTKPLSRDEICETGPPRGIILNYVCPRLFRRFQRNARAARLSPAFVSPRARDQSGHHHSSYIFHVSIRSFPIRLSKNAPRRSLDPPPLFLVSPFGLTVDYFWKFAREPRGYFQR